MNTPLASLQRLVSTTVSRVPLRARWSFADQVLISGVNVLTGILLVRALGLQEFGLFSLVLIGIQYLSSIQSASILAPMMSLFDQRGQVSSASYLATVLLHQAVLTLGAGMLLLIVSAFPDAASAIPIDLGLAIGVIVTTQFQDLARRFFYVSERPTWSFASDLVAYGVRLAVLAVLAFLEALTMERVWIVIATTSALAVLLLAPDLYRLRPRRSEMKTVTQRHARMAGWLLGNTVVGWFSESNFILLIVGAALGPVQLGAVRAVQNLIHLANLLLQALENFVPSAATKSLIDGGHQSLLRYVNRVAVLGATAIVVMTLLLMVLADPILLTLYGQTFPHQLAILAILGAYAAFGHMATIVLAGLRSLAVMRPAFAAQAAIAVVSLAVAWPLATFGGVVAALGGILAARAALAGSWIVLLRVKAASYQSTARVGAK